MESNINRYYESLYDKNQQKLKAFDQRQTKHKAEKEQREDRKNNRKDTKASSVRILSLKILIQFQASL